MLSNKQRKSRDDGDVSLRPNDIVWAKIRGFPWWPSRVLRQSGPDIEVRFFGPGESRGSAARAAVAAFEPEKDKMKKYLGGKKPSNNKALFRAIAEAREALDRKMRRAQQAAVRQEEEAAAAEAAAVAAAAEAADADPSAPSRLRSGSMRIESIMCHGKTLTALVMPKNERFLLGKQVADLIDKVPCHLYDFLKLRGVASVRATEAQITFLKLQDEVPKYATYVASPIQLLPAEGTLKFVNDLLQSTDMMRIERTTAFKRSFDVLVAETGERFLLGPQISEAVGIFSSNLNQRLRRSGIKCPLAALPQIFFLNKHGLLSANKATLYPMRETLAWLKKDLGGRPLARAAKAEAQSAAAAPPSSASSAASSSSASPRARRRLSVDAGDSDSVRRRSTGRAGLRTLRPLPESAYREVEEGAGRNGAKLAPRSPAKRTRADASASEDEMYDDASLSSLSDDDEHDDGDDADDDGDSDDSRDDGAASSTASTRDSDARRRRRHTPPPPQQQQQQPARKVAKMEPPPDPEAVARAARLEAEAAARAAEEYSHFLARRPQSAPKLEGLVTRLWSHQKAACAKEEDHHQ